MTGTRSSDKAYQVLLVGRVVKEAIVWADSADDARRKFYDAGTDWDHNPDVLVLDNTYGELRMKRPRRWPQEDRC